MGEGWGEGESVFGPLARHSPLATRHSFGAVAFAVVLVGEGAIGEQLVAGAGGVRRVVAVQLPVEALVRLASWGGMSPS